MTSSRLLRCLGAVLVLAFMAIVAILHMLDIKTVFKFPLAATIGYFFIAVVTLVVAYMSAKSYLTSGSRTLILLGCSALAFGSAALLTGLTVELLGAGNVPSTFINTGLLLTAILQFQSAFLALFKVPSEEAPRRGVMVVAYLVVLVFMALLVIATLQGVTSPFFIPGVGTTLLSDLVKGVSLPIFAVSSLIFMRLYFKSKVSLLYWYSLAVALIATGLFAHLLLRVTDVPIQWMGRFAYYMSGVYLLISILTTFKSAGSKGRE